MDPTVLQQFNAGWAAHAQGLAIRAEQDNRGLTAAIAASLIQANDPVQYAGMNVASRVPTTLEHIPYPGYSYPPTQAKG